MAERLPTVKLQRLEVRCGGRFGPTPKSGRRGSILFAVDVPETVRDYLPDLEAPAPETVGAVYLYMGDELVKSWTAREHEVTIARQAELSDLDGELRERQLARQGLEQQLELLKRAIGIAEGQLAAAEASRKEAVLALAAERERATAERQRFAEAEARLDAWQQERQSRALAETTAFVQQCVAQAELVQTQLAATTTQVGAIAQSVLDREGTTGQLAATRQVEAQSQALSTTQLLGGMVQAVRDAATGALVPRTGPSSTDKLVDLLKLVVMGPIGLGVAKKLGVDVDPPTEPL